MVTGLVVLTPAKQSVTYFPYLLKVAPAKQTLTSPTSLVERDIIVKSALISCWYGYRSYHKPHRHP